MNIEDKELFESSLTDTQEEQHEVVEETVQADHAVHEEGGQPRDENGRFATKEQQADPAPARADAATQDASQAEAHVPSWRLREEREAREAADRRFAEAQAHWQRQFAELQARLPKPEQPQVPDVFEKPNEFLEHGIRQAVDPIANQIGQMREFFSRRDAERDHGSEKVKAAYDWLAQGMANRDPEVVATYQRAMQSMHPFGDIVQAHQQRMVFQQIGSDPNAWFEKEPERRMADPQFAANQLQKIQQSTRTSNDGSKAQNTTIKLPPSLNRASSAQIAADDDGDMSDAGLFAYATR